MTPPKTNLNSFNSGNDLIQKVMNKTKIYGKDWSKNLLNNTDALQKNSNVPPKTV